MFSIKLPRISMQTDYKLYSTNYSICSDTICMWGTVLRPVFCPSKHVKLSSALSSKTSRVWTYHKLWAPRHQFFGSQLWNQRQPSPMISQILAEDFSWAENLGLFEARAGRFSQRELIFWGPPTLSAISRHHWRFYPGIQGPEFCAF